MYSKTGEPYKWMHMMCHLGNKTREGVKRVETRREWKKWGRGMKDRVETRSQGNSNPGKVLNHDGSIIDPDNQAIFILIIRNNQFSAWSSGIIKPVHHFSPKLFNSAHDSPDQTDDG
jgi:hypothetical protein